jgi:hypothetical protein
MYFELFLEDHLPAYGVLFLSEETKTRTTLDGFVFELRAWLVEQATCLVSVSRAWVCVRKSGVSVKIRGFSESVHITDEFWKAHTHIHPAT